MLGSGHAAETEHGIVTEPDTRAIAPRLLLKCKMREASSSSWFVRDDMPTQYYLSVSDGHEIQLFCSLQIWFWTKREFRGQLLLIYQKFMRQPGALEAQASTSLYEGAQTFQSRFLHCGTSCATVQHSLL